MSHRASAVVLLVLSFPLVLLGIAAWNQASDEAGVRASQLAQSVSAPDARDRADFARYAESTLDRQASAERDRNWLLGSAAAGLAGAFVVLLTSRRRRATEMPAPATAGSAFVGSGGSATAGSTGSAAAGSAGPAAAQAPPRFRPCRACQWQISVEATACPRCGCPHVPQPAQRPTQPAASVGAGQRALYVLLLVLGLGSAAVIYTVLFNDLSETQLVAISPYWIFPSVFGYYGLVAQRMEAKLQTTHLDTVSDQLLNVIKETGLLGQAFAFLIHAPFLLVKSRVPWVTALVGSLIWAIALSLFFNVVFPKL